MKLSEELVWRGFVAEHTLEDVADLDKAPCKFYFGVDPSAPSMTIGNLAALMMCKVFMRHGYPAVLLAGGATGQIGDPKENGERDLKPLAEVEANVRGLEAQFRQIVGEDFELVNNNDWFVDIRLMPFLREIFKQFSMTQLLDRKFVQDRIGEGGSGISLAEFCYTTIQGYDFLHLYREKGVSLQLCGADQFGNCVSGVHLVQRLAGAKVDVWSCPLIVDKVSGKKFGKSEGNAVWLDGSMTSVFDFYQFWLNQPDEAVEDYLKFYSLIQPEELVELMKRHRENLGERLAQRRLADEVTKIVHGAKKADGVARATGILFGGGQLSEADFEVLAEFVPAVDRGMTVVEALVAAGLAGSKAAARQLIGSGAIVVNEEKITKDMEVTQCAVIRRGKNKFILVR